MDNKKFGRFILSLRKEKGWTQLELAQKLNVTDKAVSKWERGIGFPDINMIEPLAETLGVSVIEIMRSERTDESAGVSGASEAISNVIDIAAYQRKKEIKNIFMTVILISVIVMLIFLIDNMLWIGFAMVCLPIILAITGVWLIGFSVYKAKQKSEYGITLFAGVLALAYPALLFLLLCFGFVLGGPVAS